MLDLTREAKIHTLNQVIKLKTAIRGLEEINGDTTDAIFARRLGEVIIACDVFIMNTKHQHRTICDIATRKRA